MKKNLNVIVNLPCDGLENAVITSTEETPEFYERMMEKYLSSMFDGTPVGRVFYNVCYKRSCVPSETADTYLYNIKRGDDGFPILGSDGKAIKEYLPDDAIPLFNGKFRKVQERNIDLIQIAMDISKRKDLECWFSFRMNDHHFPDDPVFNSSFHYDNAKELGVCGSKMFIDYTKEPVRNYYKNYIKELCENYDIDGIEFDFLRSCPIMSEVCVENTEIINNFVRELKEIINNIAVKKGRTIQTAARVYAEIETNEEYGIDPAKWVSEGLVEILVLENWYIPTYFSMPVKEWREAIEKNNINNYKYSILCGADWAVRCGGEDYHSREMYISLEQFKGFVSSSYQSGADGIYIFNHFTTAESGKTYIGGNCGNVTYYIDNHGNKVSKDVLKNKFCSANSQQDAEDGEREYVLTYTKKPVCPVSVSNWIPFSFKINTGTAIKSGNFTVILGVDDCEDTLSVSVNGSLTNQIDDIKKPNGFVWKESENPIKQVQHISEVAYRVMRFAVTDLSVIKDGINKVIVNGKSFTPNIIRWIGIQVNDTEE